MIYVAILGFGVVGSGVGEILTQNRTLIRERIGKELCLARILDRRKFPDSPFGTLVTDRFEEILNDARISVVIETMGGAHPAYEFTKAALESGKSVVSSNKEVVARFGAELLEIAAAHNVRYLFEASVGGGIPIIRPMQNDLASNAFRSVSGILNGTTNYILTQMFEHGTSFDAALKQAQQNGYAEADPTADIDGLDAARKIVILAGIAFGKMLDPNRICCQGIRAISARDVAVADFFGYAIKLIGHATRIDGRVLALVSPRMLPKSSPLAGISDVYNGILVDTDMLGEALFYGKGAGKLPTASAVVGDVIDISSHEGQPCPALRITPATDADYFDINDHLCGYCYTFKGAPADLPRVLAVFGAREAYCKDGVIAVLTDTATERENTEKAARTGLELLSAIRLL